MKRDKIISVRVNSDLLRQVKDRIASLTDVFSGSKRTYYTYQDLKRPNFYDQFTVSDLLEEKLKEYLAEGKL